MKKLLLASLLLIVSIAKSGGNKKVFFETETHCFTSEFQRNIQYAMAAASHIQHQIDESESYTYVQTHYPYVQYCYTISWH